MSALAAATQTPSLREALGRQSFTDWTIVDETGRCSSDLSCFAGVSARYYLLSLSDTAVADALATPGTLLYWLVRAEIDQIGVLLLRDGAGAVAGAIVQKESFLYHSDVPQSRSFADDLVDHAIDLGVRVGAIVAADRFPVDVPTATNGTGWRTGIGAAPATVELPPAAPQLWTCNTNNLYGTARVLSEYCNVNENLPITGQVQHGWEPGAGIMLLQKAGGSCVADRLRALDESLFDRFYVWNSMSRERARAGLVQTEVVSSTSNVHQVQLIEIGAPYLYLPDRADPGPLHGLLAVPSHSIAASHVSSPWAAYLDELDRFAATKKFSSVTVLLYWTDDTPELRRLVEERGFVPATCGIAGDPAFLRRVRSFIRRHAAVTADCLCSAAMYALYEQREFWLAGRVDHDVPDRFSDMVKDWDWIRANYPGIHAGGTAGRDEALRELGTKRPADELRQVLWHWVY